MKTIVMMLFVLVLPNASAQWAGVPRNVEFALSRIEQALRDGNPASIEDLFPGGITMRIEDSLYQSIPSVYAIPQIERFFAGKDSVQFRFTAPGSGALYYTKNGKRESVAVDVWLRRGFEGIEIYAVNISNYPLATVFYDIPRQKEQTD